RPEVPDAAGPARAMRQKCRNCPTTCPPAHVIKGNSAWSAAVQVPILASMLKGRSLVTLTCVLWVCLGTRPLAGQARPPTPGATGDTEAAGDRHARYVRDGRPAEGVAG